MPGRFYIEGKQAKTDSGGQGSTIANWQASESEVLAVGAEGRRYKVHDLTVSIHNLVGTEITIRIYKIVNRQERGCYEQKFNPAADPVGLPIVCGTWGIRNILRVTAQSNSAADNGKTIDYDYMLEAA